MSEVKKVRLYNIQSMLDRMAEEDEKFAKFLEENNLEARTNYFIVEGTKGILYSYDTEGVHGILKDRNDRITVSLFEKPDDEGTPVYPKYDMTVKIGRIIDLADYTEHDVKDMVRIFGARLDRNYALLLESLEEIGIDLSEYDTNRGR